MMEKANKTKSSRNSANNRTNNKTARSEKQQTVRESMSSDERRKAERLRRKKKQKRNRIIIYSIVFLLIIILAIVLSLTVFFKVDSFAVSGDEIYNSEQIITSSGLETGDNMFLFNKKKISENIQQSLPYVQKADIKRSVSGNVTIKIYAAKATLALDMGDSYCLLNSQGKVLEDGVAVVNDNVAIINASKVLNASPGYLAEFERTDDLGTIVNIQNLIEKYQLNGINSINVSESSNIKLLYNQRIEMKMGLLTSIESKMEFVKATLKKLDNDKPEFTGVIDFTVENKAYLNSNNEDTTIATTIPETTTVINTFV